MKSQYKCSCKHCGTVCIKLNVALSSLPKRKTDGSHCLMLAKHTCLVDVGKGEQKLIKREGGAERQWRLTCLGCDLMVGYQSVPWTEENVKVVYLLSDALVEESPEGVVPSSAPASSVLPEATNNTSADAPEAKKRKAEPLEPVAEAATPAAATSAPAQ